MQGHAGECWGMSVGAGGLHAASCGADRALRLYVRTDEPVVIGDEDDEQIPLATGDKVTIILIYVIAVILNFTPPIFIACSKLCIL